MALIRKEPFGMSLESGNGCCCGWRGWAAADTADQPDLQHVPLRANRQAQPPEKVTEKKQYNSLIHTYIRIKLKKMSEKIVT